MTKYRVRKFGDLKIEAVEVERETEKSIYIKNVYKQERRTAKVSDFAIYFNRWIEAYSYLLETSQGSIDGLKKRLDEAVKGHRDIVAMVEEGEA